MSSERGSLHGRVGARDGRHRRRGRSFGPLTGTSPFRPDWHSGAPSARNESGTRPWRVQGRGSETRSGRAGTRSDPAPRTGNRAAASSRSGGGDTVRLGALGALDDLEVDPLALFEALVPVHLDGRVVDEDVLAAVDGDEAEALLGVEPLHGALCHVCSHVRACGRPLWIRGTGPRSSARLSRTWN